MRFFRYIIPYLIVSCHGAVVQLHEVDMELMMISGSFCLQCLHCLNPSLVWNHMALIVASETQLCNVFYIDSWLKILELLKLLLGYVTPSLRMSFQPTRGAGSPSYDVGQHKQYHELLL